MAKYGNSVSALNLGAGQAEEQWQEEGGSREKKFGEKKRGSGRGAETSSEAETGTAALGQRVCGQREASGQTLISITEKTLNLCFQANLKVQPQKPCSQKQSKNLYFIK